ncbi:MAG: hypothetical protein ACRC0L_08545, partial [Angustibacter sp.]
ADNRTTRAELHDLSSKFCIGYGTADFITGAQAAEQWRKILPAARLVKVSGAVHAENSITSKCGESIF